MSVYVIWRTGVRERERKVGGGGQGCRCKTRQVNIVYTRDAKPQKNPPRTLWWSFRPLRGRYIPVTGCLYIPLDRWSENHPTRMDFFLFCLCVSVCVYTRSQESPRISLGNPNLTPSKNSIHSFGQETAFLLQINEYIYIYIYVESFKRIT